MRFEEDTMTLIFVTIAFSFLAIRFYTLAGAVDWCFEKVVATAFMVMAVLSFFVFVIVESFVFHLLPLAFVLVAIDMLSARSCSESIR